MLNWDSMSGASILHMAFPGAGLSNMASLLPSVAPGLGWLRELRNGGGRIDRLLTWQLASLSENSKKEFSKRPRAFYDLTSEFPKHHFLIFN